MKKVSSISALLLATTSLATIEQSPEMPNGNWVQTGITNLYVCVDKIPNPSAPCLWSFMSLRKQIAFNASYFVQISTAYSDLAQTKESYLVRKNGSLAVKPSGPDGTYHLDFSYSSITVTPMSVEKVHDWNQHRFCDLEDWTINVARDVTGSLCDGSRMISSGDRRYDIIQIVSDTIYFGDQSNGHDGSSPDLRPVEILWQAPWIPSGKF